jgi:hypothetical protein
MIDIGPILNDCPFRVFCILAKGDSYDEHVSKSVSTTLSDTDVSKTSNKRNSLGTGD